MTVHAVSRVRLDKDGRVTDLLWGEAGTKTNRRATPELVAPVVEVVDAIHPATKCSLSFRPHMDTCPSGVSSLSTTTADGKPSRWMVRQRMSGKFTIWTGLNSKR